MIQTNMAIACSIYSTTMELKNNVLMHFLNENGRMASSALNAVLKATAASNEEKFTSVIIATIKHQ